MFKGSSDISVKLIQSFRVMYWLRRGNKFTTLRQFLKFLLLYLVAWKKTVAHKLILNFQTLKFSFYLCMFLKDVHLCLYEPLLIQVYQPHKPTLKNPISKIYKWFLIIITSKRDNSKSNGSFKFFNYLKVLPNIYS